MTWTLCTSGAAISKAGANANATIVASGATLLNWATEVEGAICAECREDFVASIGSYDTRIQNALSDAASSGVAKRIISYDLAGYDTISEATAMLSINDDIYSNNLKILKEKTNQSF